MTPLEAAKALAAVESFWNDRDEGQNVCLFCDSVDGHAPDCPWLTLPAIVAALEVAERMIDGLGIGVRDGFVMPDFDVDWTCAICGEVTPWEPERVPEIFNHESDCAGQALIATLRGEGTG